MTKKVIFGNRAVNLTDDDDLQVAPVGGGSSTELSALDDAAVGVISYTNTSANTALSTLCGGLSAGDIVRVYAPTDCYINFASDALETPPASSSSMYFAAGTEKLTIPASATHINVIRVTADGTLNIAKVA